MGVNVPHSAQETTPVAGLGTVNSLLRLTMLGVVMAVGGNCGGPERATQQVSVVKPAKRSIMGETIHLPRKNAEPLELTVQRVDGLLEITVGGATYLIEELPYLPGEPIGASISNVEMDDETLSIESSYADITASRTSAQSGLEKLERETGERVSVSVDVIVKSKNRMLDMIVHTNSLLTGKRKDEPQLYTIYFVRKGPGKELAHNSTGN